MSGIPGSFHRNEYMLHKSERIIAYWKRGVAEKEEWKQISFTINICYILFMMDIKWLVRFALE